MTTITARFLALTALVCGSLAGCNAAVEPEAQLEAFAVRALELPGGAGSGQPRLSSGPDGTPIVSWLEPDGDAHMLRYSRFEAGMFAAPRTVMRGTDWLVSWADLPSVQPITSEIWAAHWLTLDASSPGAYHAATAVSRDSGATFDGVMQLNDDAAAAEHGFVNLFPFEGAIGALWLDGRQLAEWSFDDPDALLGTSLRAARIDASGAIVAREIVDELVCDCCQPDVALTSEGPIVVYRDRTPDEIRDIVVRRYGNGAWHDAVLVAADGWRIEGCPVNGPAIAAAGDSVAVAWFTAAGDSPRVRFARSADGGRSFAPAVDIDGAGSFGQVGLTLAADGTATLSWWRRAADGGLDLAARTVSAGGTLGTVHTLAHSSAVQPGDVPQLIAADGGVLAAWTDPGGAVHTLFADGF
jgi:hypothetical protein